MSADPNRPSTDGAELLAVLDRAIEVRIDARLCSLLARLGSEIAREVADHLRSDGAAPAAGRRLLLTVPAAAERLSLSRSTVYELIRRGELASVKVGATRRIPADALDAFRAARTGFEEPRRAAEA